MASNQSGLLFMPKRWQRRLGVGFLYEGYKGDTMAATRNARERGLAVDG